MRLYCVFTLSIKPEENNMKTGLSFCNGDRVCKRLDKILHLPRTEWRELALAA